MDTIDSLIAQHEAESSTGAAPASNAPMDHIDSLIAQHEAESASENTPTPPQTNPILGAIGSGALGIGKGIVDIPRNLWNTPAYLGNLGIKAGNVLNRLEGFEPEPEIPEGSILNIKQPDALTPTNTAEQIGYDIGGMGGSMLGPGAIGKTLEAGGGKLADMAANSYMRVLKPRENILNKLGRDNLQGWQKLKQLNIENNMIGKKPGEDAVELWHKNIKSNMENADAAIKNSAADNPEASVDRDAAFLSYFNDLNAGKIEGLGLESSAQSSENMAAEISDLLDKKGYGQTVSLGDVPKIRKVIREETGAWKNGVYNPNADPIKVQTGQELSNRLNNALEGYVPGIKALDRKTADMIYAQRAAENSAVRVNNERWLSPMLGAFGGYGLLRYLHSPEQIAGALVPPAVIMGARSLREGSLQGIPYRLGKGMESLGNKFTGLYGGAPAVPELGNP